MKFIAKKHYTFADLEARWDCGHSDLVQAVIDGELIPSVHINGQYSLSLFTANHDADGGLQIESVSDGDCSATRGRNGFHYLIWPRRTGVADCRFCYFSESATDHDEGDICFELTSPVGMAHVLEQGVFMRNEVARVEAISGDQTVLQTTEKPLSARERDTLLTIIAALAKGARINVDSPGKAALSIEGMTDELGAHVSKRAIEDHLKKIPDALRTRMK